MINSILQEKRKNLSGVEYSLFDSKQKQTDLVQLENLFTKYLEAIKVMCPSLTEKEINESFANTIKNISYIRIDEQDMDIPPIVFSTAEFIHNQMRVSVPNGASKEQIKHLKMQKATEVIKRHPYFAKRFINKTKMNATTRAYDVDSGIGIFAPALKTAQNTKTIKEQLEGEKIFLHEFLHAASAWKVLEQNGKEYYRQGVRIYNRLGVYDDFNEGLNEYFTVKIMKKMYPNQVIEFGYKDRVEMINQFMRKLSPQEREEIFSLYITGGGQQIVELFKNKVNSKGKSIFDYFEYYQKNEVGLEGGVSPINGKNLPLFGDAIEDCLNSGLVI